MSDFNTQIIEEFRSNEGRVGGPFAGAPMLLLHTTGARSGVERVHPLMYRPVDGGWAVFASKAGADTHPAWFHNLVARPTAEIEVGTDRHAVTARVTQGAEREAIWSAQRSDYPGFAGYEAKTERVIPVVVLEPTG
jgi:deazaflavin-dependent oxidoreductase (nitroreductase family)